MTWKWDTNPFLLGGLLAVALLYRAAMGPLRRRLAPDAPFPLRQALWIDSALLLFYVAVGSPLDEASERFLFCAHMIQHALLIFILPVMLWKGTPDWLLRPLLAPRSVEVLARFLGHPLMALLGFNLLFSSWHIPGLYEWALRDRHVHEVEHLTFVASGLWMWWPAFGPLPEHRASYGAQALYMFGLSVSQIPIFAFMAFSTQVFYPTYASAPRLIAMLGAQEDQVMGGIVMKLLGELFFVGVLIGALAKWYRQENPLPRRPPLHPARS